MVSGAVETLALIFMVVAAVKIIVLLVNPKSWIGLIKKVWDNSVLTMVISLILAAVVLYYLVIEGGVGIVQILAVSLFMALLAGVGISSYSKEVTKLAIKLLKDKDVLKKSWVYIVIWVLLLIWGFRELFLI